MTRCLIALGGNLGPVAKTFENALEQLGRVSGIAITDVSSSHRFRAVGDVAGDEFLNAAAAIRVECEPLELLDVLQSIEKTHGRTRDRVWGPRTLDLDLISFDEQVIDHPRLTVPHPACWYRRFVLDPLVEIAGEDVHAQKKLTFAALRQRLLERPLRVAFSGADAAERDVWVSVLKQTYPESVVELMERRQTASKPEPALHFWLDAEDPHENPSGPAAISSIFLSEEEKGRALAFFRAAIDSALGSGGSPRRPC
ncbi:MAG: 2-amino-4-hydroxy-6-hydroxymethyldihydropteridine diphosphokinase [Planctomycetes bacterium]|nr:2-amino-4-hydroxy-6-hydroxymethyldihydropteridine diphosphokinase [Planctomycetota bacterium]